MVKKDLDRDKEKLKTEAVEKNKEIDALKHQSLVDKKNLSILANEKESVELKLERSAQNTKNDTIKLKNVEGAKGDLQNQILQLEETLEKQRRFISRLEEARDRYMGEGSEMAHRIDTLLEEVRNSETIMQHNQKQLEEYRSELKKQQNLYHSVRNDRSQLTRAVTESHDEIADLKEKMKVLTHQFDQLKEEIIAKEMDLVKESQEKAKILKENMEKKPKLKRSLSFVDMPKTKLNKDLFEGRERRKNEKLGLKEQTSHKGITNLVSIFPPPTKSSLPLKRKGESIL